MRNALRSLCVGSSIFLIMACSDAPPTPVEEVPAPSYVEVGPAIYFGVGNECFRLADDTDGAMTTGLGGGRVALAVCARDESGEWSMVPGILNVESITGRARLHSSPPANASALAGAPSSLETLAVGHVRLTATYAGMSGAGILEITAD